MAQDKRSTWEFTFTDSFGNRMTASRSAVPNEEDVMGEATCLDGDTWLFGADAFFAFLRGAGFMLERDDLGNHYLSGADEEPTLREVFEKELKKWEANREVAEKPKATKSR